MPKHVIYSLYVQPCCVLAVSRVHLVVFHGGADPAVVAADAGEDTGVSRHGAVVAPGDDPLQLAAAHQRAAGVPLQAQADLSVTT